MLTAVIALAGGMALLVVSADRFVEGAAASAKYFGLPPLLIGILVIGFGSSMPEMVISALSAAAGNPGLALGNAIGSNIANIALILGVTAVISPVAVNSNVLSRELPYLIAVTAAMMAMVYVDHRLGRTDGAVLIVIFVGVMGWSIYTGLQTKHDEFADMVAAELRETLSRRRAAVDVVGGLVVLVISSRLMVWGGVEIAQGLGISDVVIGLTVVAIGTSLPELASSIAAVRKNEHELALGNVIGSNLFNTTIVVGITGVIAPSAIDPAIAQRDLPVMAVLTLALFVMCYGIGKSRGRVLRWEGALLLACYAAYNVYLVSGTLG